MNNETCPHCGAEKVDDADRGDYSCDTFHYHDGSILRGYIYYELQIAAQAAEIERLRQAVLDEREACSHIAWTHVCTDECKSDIDGSSCGIRIAEDIAVRARNSLSNQKRS